MGSAIEAIAVFAIILGIFFRFYHLDHKTFWGDEIVGLVRTLGFTEAEIVGSGPRLRSAADLHDYFRLPPTGEAHARSPLDTVHSLAVEDPQHPPLYYVLARLWAGLAGTSVYALRTLAALFGSLSIFAMAWLAYELFASRRTALIAASLFAVSPFAVEYAGEAREYTLWVLVALGSSTYLLRAARMRRLVDWIGFGVTTAIGLYVYPLMAFVLAAQGVCLMGYAPYRRRETLLPFFASGLVACLLYVPWLLQLWQASAAALHGLGAFMQDKASLGSTTLNFTHGITRAVIDLGHFDSQILTEMRRAAGLIGVGLIAYAVLRLMLSESAGKARAFILALVFVPAMPLLAHDIFMSGTLTGQIRYLSVTFGMVPLALAWLIAAPGGAARGVAGKIVSTSIYVFLLLIGTLSCAIASQAITWYHKANERSAEVADYINRSENPVVISDKAIEGDRGNARLLELGFYLEPTVAIRANLHCDGCLADPPPPIDVYRDIDQFRHVFVLGRPQRAVPAGSYTIHEINILIYPRTPMPLNMFGSFQNEAPPDTSR